MQYIFQHVSIPFNFMNTLLVITEPNTMPLDLLRKISSLMLVLLLIYLQLVFISVVYKYVALKNILCSTFIIVINDSECCQVYFFSLYMKFIIQHLIQFVTSIGIYLNSDLCEFIQFIISFVCRTELKMNLQANKKKT